MSLSDLKNIEERHEVIAIIHDRLRYRFAYCLECGKMNNSINLLLGKELIYSIIVTTIDLTERNIITTGDLLYTFKTCHVAVRHIVSNYNFIACCYKFDSHMTADITGTTGYKNFLCHMGKIFISQIYIIFLIFADITPYK